MSSKRVVHFLYPTYPISFPPPGTLSHKLLMGNYPSLTIVILQSDLGHGKIEGWSLFLVKRLTKGMPTQ